LKWIYLNLIIETNNFQMNIIIPYELIKKYNDIGIDLIEYLPIRFITSYVYDKIYYNDKFIYNAF